MNKQLRHKVPTNWKSLKLLLLCDLALKEANVPTIELLQLQARLREALKAELIEGTESAQEALKKALKEAA